jgi:hypothetical protein
VRHSKSTYKFLNLSAFIPLRDTDFRILTIATSLSSFATVGETVVLGWLVLGLTDSPLIVGVVLGIRSLPNALFGILAGALADSADRRLLIRRINLLSVFPVAALGVLTLVESVQVWQIAVLAFIGGTLRAFESTANTSYAYDLVGSSRAVQGLAMNSMASRLGGVVGSISLGVIMARIGAYASFFLISCTHLLTTIVMLLPKSRGYTTARRATATGALNEFLREMLQNRGLLALMVGTGLIEVFGFSHIALMPSIARDVLKVGADGLGVMTGVGRFGGLVGIFVLSTLVRTQNRGSVYLGAIFFFGILIVLLGRVPSFPMALGLLAVINAMMSVTDVLSQSLIQLSVPNELRGRAVGSWTLAVGSGPVGTMQIGALASFAGAAVALAANGMLLVAVAGIMLVIAPSIRRI